MQIPILSGTFTDENGDFRTALPRNYVPVPKRQGISNGYLRPAPGIISLGTGPGVDRASINWNGVCYRVMGTKLVRVAADGTVTTLGEVGGSGQAQMDYSFDRLSIQSGGKFFYWDLTTLTEVTDPDLGVVLSHIWVDGFFMTTDGEFLVITELNDPTAIDPLKYGSSEIDPDPIKAVLKLRNEPQAVNRYTIETFDNRGGTGFNFKRNENAQIPKGAIGSFACCIFQESVAFVGGGRRESIAVYLGNSGETIKISTQEIDKVLKGFTETQLQDVVCEVKVDEHFNQLHIRLPDRTLVYDYASSQATRTPVWFELGSGLETRSKHRSTNMVWCYDKWIVGDPSSSEIGYLDDSDGDQWGSAVGWEFHTGILYNDSRNAIIHELEFVCLPGRVALGEDPSIWTSHSEDGRTYSMPRFLDVGKQGDRTKRLRYTKCGLINGWRTQRVRGTTDSHLSFARIEARIEGLNF